MPPEEVRATGVPPVRPDARDGVAACALVLLAWAIFRPDLPLPFDYVDFPENLWLLQNGESFLDRFGILMGVYREHGRWSPIVMGLLAAQWSWFEWWTPGWQWLRFAICSGVAGLAYAFFRRLHLHPSGAFAAAAFLIVSPSAVIAWTRLSTAEPIGTLFLLIACHLAIRGRRGGLGWAVGVAVMLLLTMWTKEIMAFAFALPAYLAVAANTDGTLGPARLDRPARRTTVATLIAFAMAAIPILLVYFTTPAGSFAGRYGVGEASVTDIVGSTLAALLPFAPANAGSHVSLLVAVAALLVIWLAGWHRALQPSVGRAHRYRVLLLAAVLPLFGALVYAPWPFYILVYAFPCLAAGALLFGQATSSLWTARGVSRVVGLAGVTVTLSFSIAQAANEAIRTRTLQKAFGETVERVAEFRGIDSVLVAVSNDQFDPRGNFGPRFWFYARALGVPWPGVRDIACDEASHLTPARALILRLNIMCDDGPRSAQSIIYPHRRFIWPDPRPRPDTVRVDLITPLLGGSRP